MKSDQRNLYGITWTLQYLKTVETTNTADQCAGEKGLGVSIYNKRDESQLLQRPKLYRRIYMNKINDKHFIFIMAEIQDTTPKQKGNKEKEERSIKSKV